MDIVFFSDKFFQEKFFKKPKYSFRKNQTKIIKVFFNHSFDLKILIEDEGKYEIEAYSTLHFEV